MENNSQTVAATIKSNKSHIAVAIVLIAICCIVGGYFVAYLITPVGYHEMYILDSQNQAVNYPQTLVINQNSTFITPIAVTNRMHTGQEYQVQIKIVHYTTIFPVEAPTYSTYEFSLDDGHTWEDKMPITINTAGNYNVVFELYAKDDGDYVFTYNFCILHINVTTDIV